MKSFINKIKFKTNHKRRSQKKGRLTISITICTNHAVGFCVLVTLCSLYDKMILVEHKKITLSLNHIYTLISPKSNAWKPISYLHSTEQNSEINLCNDRAIFCRGRTLKHIIGNDIPWISMTASNIPWEFKM